MLPLMQTRCCHSVEKREGYRLAPLASSLEGDSGLARGTQLTLENKAEAKAAMAGNGPGKWL